MEVSKRQIWVTSALTEADVKKALVLCHSLKMAFTSRPVAVIFSESLQSHSRKLLKTVFDLVLYLDDGIEIKEKFASEDFAKLFAISSLKLYDKAVYLSPSVLALQNPDGIFEEYECVKGISGLVLPEKGTSVFLFKPSLGVGQVLFDGFMHLTKSKETDFEDYLKTWIKNQSSANAGFHPMLKEKYNCVLQAGNFITGDEEIVFANLLDLNPLHMANGSQEYISGDFEKQVLAYWRKLFDENVKPLLEKSATLVLTSAYSPQYKTEPIAIVGMSCRYPGSNNLKEFWNLLFSGDDGTCTPPPFRWLREQSCLYKPEYRKTNAGFLQVPVDSFDCKFFGVSPKEVDFMDPQLRLVYELVWEALEDACIDPHSLKGTPGSVFLGSWLNDYKDILMSSGKREFYRTYMCNSIGAAAARISHFLDITGPSIATESGCSSAMVAVHLACKSLRLGETNLALACGVNLLLHPFDKDVMPMVIAPDGHCKTFSEDADGFARGEGCGVLVLKRLSDAVRDKDNIWGLIRGSAMVQEGTSKSMGTPTVQSEAMAMSRALQDANVEPEQVSFIETHGTGTPVGDPLEVAAIAKSYGNRKEPILIGSVKTNVGHTESCSGITGIMKVVLALKNELIPAHRNFSKLNPDIDLDSVPAIIPHQAVEWKRIPGKPRLAGVSSFGITGTDAHIILEESPDQFSTPINFDFERPLHILKLSAKTEEALDALLKNYADTLLTNSHLFPDICFSGNAGRANFPCRALLIAKSKEETVQLIQQNKIQKATVSGEAPKICFLFTGQGSQYPGMAKVLYQASPIFQTHFDLCHNILMENYKIDIKKIMWESSDSTINKSVYSQTSIFCVEYALQKLWEFWGIKPDFVLGHSLGEFAAAVSAGILSFQDAIKLVAERSLLIESLPPGKMLVVRGSYQKVKSAMTQFASGDKTKLLDFAAINFQEQTVLAGDSEVVEDFSRFCHDSFNIKCSVLGATHAFHSKHMDPILGKYKKIARSVKISASKCGYISGLRGKLINEEINEEYWVDHTRERVNFLEASRNAVELGCNVFIEIGPQPVLSALTMTNTEKSLICLPSLKRNEENWNTILNSLGKLYLNGVNIDWQRFDRFYNRQKIHELPNHPFFGKKYWPSLNHAGSETVHPLLGSSIPNPSAVKLYQSGIDLESTHEFVADHAIGDTVVFPGAAFLEICLAAGLAAIEDSQGELPTPTRGMKIENFQIEAPLGIQKGKVCQVQTIVENSKSGTSDCNDLSVKVYHSLSGDSSSFHLHAKATYFPLLSEEENISRALEAERLQSIVETPGNSEIPLKVYENLNTVGLKFGPAFKSIERIWKDDKAEWILAKLKEIKNEDGYLLHPVIIDAMMQTAMMLKADSKDFTGSKKLYVPVKIGKFIWLAKNQTDTFYAFASEENKNSALFTCKVLLLNGSGNVLAEMSEIEFMETTAKSIEAIIDQQTTTMPGLWEEIWRPQLGPMQQRANLKLCNGAKFCTEDEKQELNQKCNTVSMQVQKTIRDLDYFVYVNILKALYECGLEELYLGFEFNEEEMRKKLGIKDKFHKLFAYFLKILIEEGILEKVEDDYTVMNAAPNLMQILRKLESPEYTINLVDQFQSTTLLTKVGYNLSKILTGEIDPLSVLFPEQFTAKNSEGCPSIADFYMELGLFSKTEEAVRDSVSMWLKHWKKVENGKKQVMRVLEVGAGTGSCTGVALELLDKFGVEFEYTFTDISSAFFIGAQEKFQKWANSIKYKILNIEDDPISQGFVPEYFDCVLASHVIHATKDVKESLANVKTLLKPFGRFDIMEVTSQNRMITFLFGVLEGYWRFTDFELRPTHTTLTIHKWVETLNSAGFELSEVFPCQNNGFAYICTTKRLLEESPCSTFHANKINTWIVFYQDGCIISEYLKNKLSALPGRQVVIIRPNKAGLEGDFKVGKDKEEDFQALFKQFDGNIEGIIYAWSLNQKSSLQEEILQPFINLAKSITSLKQHQPRLVTLFSGISPIPDNDFQCVSASTIWGFAKSWRNEITQINCKCVDIGPFEVYEKNNEIMLQIFYEIWNGSGKSETQVAYSGLIRYIPKFQSHKQTLNNLKLPKGTNRFELLLPESKSISDLEFVPSQVRVLQETDVEVKVEAYALNFRDLFSVLKPIEEFKDVNGIGYDFSGVVAKTGSEVTKWQVGDRVFGININNDAMPSHVKTNQDNLFRINEDLAFTEAVTLPIVFITAYYCLEKIAKVTAQDTVLIHTGSGGVGLASIQICRYLGARIICTAGSSRKRRFLKSIGIEYIFNSRNTEYENKILDVTNGKGVDVVLNTLTSDGFKEASLNCCGNGARFVEISKLQVWTAKEVETRRPDVKYSIVDLSTFAQDSEKWKALMEDLDLVLKENYKMQPLPFVCFDALNIREALKYLAKAEHIGKVVVKMPDSYQENDQIHTNLFHEKGTYLITGGLGGIGFVVCKWMLDRGARHIVLAGRSSPSSSMQTEISKLNTKFNSNIVSLRVDVGNYEDLKNLLQSEFPCLELPPLKGIMHCAGILQDEFLHKQDWNEVSKTLNAKVEGTLNLHELTRTLRLDFFVMFSSMAALFGSPGQTSYTAANHFQNSFAHYRHSLGLPTTVINWGQWGEVGLATEIDIPGIKPLSNSHGLAALEYALKSNKTQLSAINVHSFAMVNKIIPNLSSYLDPRIWQRESNMTINSIGIKSEEFWGKYDTLLSLEEKVDFMKEQIRFVLRNTLKLEMTEVIPDEQDFKEMGVDSLMLVEMKNSMQNILGDRATLNPSVLRDCANVQMLAQTLVKIIEGSEDFKIPTDEEVSERIREDCVLPENIKAKEGQITVDIDKVSKILLTGATGTLGPYILKELSLLPQITEIVCLMRPHKTQAPYERLRSILENRGILEGIDLGKVSCVSGNVTSPGLGIEKDAYKILCDKIDAVFHLAAKIQHLEHYRKENKTPGNDSRAVNITGVKNILKFCTSGTKLKHIFYTGSIVSAAKLDKERAISEDWPEIEDFEGITTFAYPITKFVGDVLLKEALTKRGIPGKLIRFPNIIGDKSGRFVLENNHVMLRILYILKTQMITDNPLPLCTLPVDVCAKTGVELFFKKDCKDGLYNVFHDKPELEQELVPVVKELGFNVDIVDFPTFAERVRNSKLEDSPFVIFKDLYNDDVDKVVEQVTSSVPCIREWLVNGGCANENFFRSGKLLKYIPDFYDNLEKPTECLKRDLLYARKQGWLKKYGLE